MTAYLDASVVVPMFVTDAHTPRVRAWFATGIATTESSWTATEFSSALAFRVRSGRMTDAQRAAIESDFDAWLSMRPSSLGIDEQSFRLARIIIRSDPSLRAPDALNLAVAEQAGLELATLDTKLAAAAIRRGLPISAI